ncbi:MAG TPA: adenosylhomocysteinase [Candidatus Avimonoglobus intestinipullorum]|uniref:Adenosylhomocysteinase n=1 Tax=Candidatus Avimonoglobus intestinipullorum TaxID=2840699 RepID=A0A9D1LUZ4_9FIRM|nr:adenosylhomocysteinase [Candidatus Avimonoglobus intestinipullorum]
MSAIRDIKLWESGARKIEWVRRNMPLLRGIEAEFARERPFAGLNVALSIHLEAKTAYLCKVLAAGGANMFVTGSNPLSTQDDVAAALVHEGLHVYAWHACTAEEYRTHMKRVIEAGPHIIIDDGGDLVNLIHTEYPEKLGQVLGGCEETTTGIIRLVSMAKAGALKFPMVLVNNAKCKYLFDNRYGTGQSVWDGINRTTNLIVAGKTVVVAGYGWCGKGVAMRAKGFGARVVVTEIDPIKALEARMDGFDVMEMNDAACIGDLFVTVTGCRDVIGAEAFLRMKNGAILCNAGHFNVEVNVEELERIAVQKEEQRANIMGYRLENGNWLYLLAEGRLVNLAAGDGHPAEIMDMSFSIQAMSAAYIARNRGRFEKMVVDVPREIDEEMARRKLASLGIRIDELTAAQRQYLNSWNL